MKQFKLVVKSICSVLLLWALSTDPVVAQTITVPTGFKVEEFATTPRPIGMHFDPVGDLLVVNVVGPSGTITKISIMNGQNVGASIFAGPIFIPQYIDLDANDAVFTATTNRINGNVIKIAPNGSTISVFAPGSGGVLNDGRGVAFDANGDLFVINNIIPSQDAFLDGFVTKFLI